MLRTGGSIIKDFGSASLEGFNKYKVAAIQYVYANGRVTTGELAEHIEKGSKVAARILKNYLNWAILNGMEQTSKIVPSQFYSLRKEG